MLDLVTPGPYHELLLSETLSLGGKPNEAKRSNCGRDRSRFRYRGRPSRRRSPAEGARVTLVDIDRQSVKQRLKGSRKTGGDAVALIADVGSPPAVESLSEFVARQFGTLDILVNDAAIQVNKTVEATTPEEWDRLMAVNVGGVFLCSRPFCRRCENLAE